MTTDSLPASTGAVDDQAINRVLEAQHAAEKAVERCTQHARQLVREARFGAQRIQQRCDTRITLIHMRCSQRLAEHGRQAARAGEQAGEAASIDHEALRRAIETLAASLSGGDGSAA